MNAIPLPWKPLPTVARLRDVFSYDEATGALCWRVSLRGRGAIAGREAGTVRPDGYRSVMIDQKRYPVHRIIWKMVTGSDPEVMIDHIDGDRLNNRISNLREADFSENAHNSALPTTNTSGHRCVFFYKRTGKWRAQVSARGVAQHVGYFATKEQAIAAADRTLSALHGEYRRAA